MRWFMLQSLMMLSMWSLVSPIVAAEAPKQALLVAVTKYQHAEMNEPPLEFPEADAKELAGLFRESGYSVELLLGKAATQDAIRRKLDELKDKGEADGVVVIGLFGHGIEYDGTHDACYCPYDTTMHDVLLPGGKPATDKFGKPRIEPDPKSVIKMAELLTALRKSPAGNRILLADCCRNDPKAARGRAFGSQLTLQDLPKNTAALFACSESEQAFESREWGHGAFSKCLIEELRTLSTQGRATAGKLSDNLRPKVQGLVADSTKGRQSQTPNALVSGFVDFQLKSVSPSTLAPIKPVPDSSSPADQGFEGKKAGDRKELVPGIAFRWCPAGKFTMGTPGATDHEKPAQVTLSRGFWLGETELTQGQWKELMGKSPWEGYPVRLGADYPAIMVSHDDAAEYCRKLTERERQSGRLSADWRYRLPTEAQWEYACRAGTTTLYSFGDNADKLGEYAWFIKNTEDERYAHRVGQKQPNAWGLRDMHGNVDEWCRDWYDGTMPEGVDPAGGRPNKDLGLVYRGGSCFSRAEYCRSAARSYAAPVTRLIYHGFRLAAVPQ